MKPGIGLFIGNDVIAVAQVRKSLGSISLAKSAEIPWNGTTQIANFSRDTIEQKIKEVFEKAQIDFQQGIAVGLLGKDVVIRFFEMPILPKDERMNAIRFEAQKYISFDIKDLYYNYDAIIDKSSKKMQVLFIASPKTSIDHELAILTSVGLKTNSLEPVPLAMTRIVWQAASIKDDSNYLVLDLRAQGILNIAIIKRNMVLFSRDCMVSKFGDDPVKPSFDSLRSETQLTLSYFSRNFKNQKMADIFFFSENLPEVSDWSQKLSTELGVSVKNCQYGNVFGKDKLLSSSLAMAVGLALREIDEVDSSKLNLLPKESAKRTEPAVSLTPDEENKKLQQWFVVEFVILIVALFATHFYFSSKISSLQNLSMATSSVSQLEEKKLSLLTKKNFFSGLASDRLYFTTILNELAKNTPDSILLKEINYSNDETESLPQNLSMKLDWEVSNTDAGSAFLEADQFTASLRSNKDFMKGFQEIKLNSGKSSKLGTIFSVDLGRSNN